MRTETGTGCRNASGFFMGNGMDARGGSRNRAEQIQTRLATGYPEPHSTRWRRAMNTHSQMKILETVSCVIAVAAVGFLIWYRITL